LAADPVETRAQLAAREGGRVGGEAARTEAELALDPTALVTEMAEAEARPSQALSQLFAPAKLLGGSIAQVVDIDVRVVAFN
jgi:hypothetical protein